MPRRRNNPRASIQLIDVQPQDEIIWDDTNVTPEYKEPCRPVKDCLKNNYYRLLKEKKEDMQCSVCLDPIDCEKCFYLLSCSHYFHIGCAIKCTYCPLCRQ